MIHLATTFRRRVSSRFCSRNNRWSSRLWLERLEDRRLLTAQIELYGSYIPASYAGVGFQENEVATMQASLNGQPDTNKGDFQAQINWGDGKTSKGDLVYMGSSGSAADYLIKGGHVYQNAGTNIPVDVTVTGPDGTTVSLNSNDLDYADVATMPSGIAGTQPPSGGSSAQPENVQILVYASAIATSFAGVGFQENEVATMQVSVNGQADTKLSDFHAYINWGDSASWDSGDLVYSGSSGSAADYIIKGSHVYQNAATGIPIVVYVTGPDGTSANLAPNDVDYEDVASMPSGIDGTQPPSSGDSAPANVQILIYASPIATSFAGVGFQENAVATMQVSVDGQADEKLSDFHAYINWGDSASWDSGDLVYQGSDGSAANYLIKGSHVYQNAATGIPIVVYVTGPDGTSGTLAPSDVDYEDVVAMPSGIPGTQPSGTANPSAPEAVGILVYASAIPSSYAGVGFQNVVVASVQASVNGQADPNAGDFHAEINWGDSASWDSGTVIYQESSGSASDFIIEGSHVYQKPGTDIPIVVYVTGPDGTSATLAPSDVDYADVTANPNAITVGSLSPSQWQVNEPNYDGAIPVSGGNGAYQNLQIGNLPAGLSASVLTQTLNGQQIGTIDITGTPTESGTFNLQVSIQDGNGDSGSATESLTITAAPISVGTLSPSEWDMNEPGYDGTIPVSGGSGSYSNLVVTGLPSGLTASLSGSTINVTGTPIESGTFSNITVSLQDSDEQKGDGTETLTINPALRLGDLDGTDPNDPSDAAFNGSIDGSGDVGAAAESAASGPMAMTASIGIGQLTGARAYVGELYSGTIPVSGGEGAYLLVPKSLPTGWTATLSSGTITVSGIPTWNTSAAIGPIYNLALELEVFDEAKNFVDQTYTLPVYGAVQDLLDHESPPNGNQLPNLGTPTPIGPPTTAYNCYAYAATQTNPQAPGWVWGGNAGEKLPPGGLSAPNTPVYTPQGLLNFFAKYGWYQIATGTAQPPVPPSGLVVIYATAPNQFQHAALVTPNGVFAKMGQLATFEFSDVNQMAGGQFGQPAVWLAQKSAIPQLQITPSHGAVYTGAPFRAAASVAAPNGSPGATLEGVPVILRYYAGRTATGQPLAAAPVSAGTYTVVASFAGSTDYTSASKSMTLTIAKATPTIIINDFSNSFVVFVVGVKGPSSSLEGVAPRVSYYERGKLVPGAPRKAGTYTVVATFAGSQDYNAATKSATIRIGEEKKKKGRG
jgi:hypothetical protein